VVHGVLALTGDAIHRRLQYLNGLSGSAFHIDIDCCSAAII
jgi:hypothetical protein